MAELVASWEVLDTQCLWVLDSWKSLHGKFADAVEDHGISRVVILGGSSAVPVSVERSIRNLSNRPSTERIFGATRLQTAIKVLAWIDENATEDDTKVSAVVDMLEDITVAAERPGGYDRDLFKHWVDADGDGCDARREVLIEEAVTRPAIGVRCSLSGGKWLSRYDGKETRGNGSSFDVDHMVPLAEAWESGARNWSADRRERFANDLGYADSLVAVSSSSNRSKGARDPAEWLPPSSEVHCWYAAAWIGVKTRWGLSADRAEVSKLRGILSGCEDSDLGNLPEAVSAGDDGTGSGSVGTSNVGPSSSCHPAYDPCLPNMPGDALNCGDLARNQKPVHVKMPGVDPYRLDRDGDGVGCGG